MDSKGKDQATQPRKRITPSMQRRNERRRLAFMAAKQSPVSAAGKVAEDTAGKACEAASEEIDEKSANECDKCDDNASCEAGFNQHKS